MRTAPFRWGMVIDRSPFDEDFDSAGRRFEARICSRRGYLHLELLQLLTPSLLPAAKKLRQNLRSVSDHRIVSEIFHWKQGPIVWRPLFNPLA